MTASVPFDRGKDPLDLYTAGLLSSAVYYTDDTHSQELWSAIGCSETFEFPAPSPFFSRCRIGITSQHVIVVISGTENALQLLSEVLVSEQQEFPEWTGQVLTYFGVSAQLLLADIRQTVTDRKAGRMLVCVGHSLGGALAQLVGRRLSNETGMKLRCFVFGTPRVGDSVYTQLWHTGELVQLQNVGDPVPGVPPTTWTGTAKFWPVPFALPSTGEYRHAGEEVGLSAPGVVSLPPNLDLTETIYNLFNSPSVFGHLMEAYQTLLFGVTRGQLPFKGETGYANPDLLDTAAHGMYALQPLSYAIHPFTPIPPGPVDPASLPIGFFVGGTIVANPNLKLTMFFESGKQGWSETIYSNKHASVSALLTLAPQIVLLRRGILCPPAACTFVRVNDVDHPRISDGIEYTTTQGAGTRAGQPDDLRSGVEVRLNVADGYRRSLLIRGLSENDTGGTAIAGMSAPGVAALKAYMDFITGASASPGRFVMGIHRQVLTNPSAILAVTSSTQTVSITVSAPNWALLMAGARIIRIKGAKGDRGINGLWKGDAGSVSPDIKIVGAFNTGPWVSGTGVAYTWGFTLDDVTSYKIWDDGGRKVGRPFGADRGRRSNRYTVR